MTMVLAATRQRVGRVWRRAVEPLVTALTRPRPVRQHLLALVIGAVLPLLAFSAFAVWRVAVDERAHYEQELRGTAHDLADDIDRAIDGMIVTLRSLATSTHLANGNLKQFHDQATAALNGSRLSLILIDPSRKPLVNTNVPFGTELPPTIADSDAPARVLATKKPAVSNVVIGVLLKRPFLNVDVPVIVDGEVRYILLLAFEPDYVQRILQTKNVSSGWVTGVSDGNGRIIARSVNHEQYVNTLLPDELYARRNDSSVFHAKDIDGVPVLRAVARMRHADWMVAAMVPIDKVEAASRSAYLTLASLGMMALGLSLFAAVALAQALSRSMLQLEAGSHAIKGDAPVAFKSTLLSEAETVQTALREAHQARRNIEEELRLTAERLTLAARVAGVAHATVTYGEDGSSILDVSPELGALLGVPVGALPGTFASAMIHPGDRDEVERGFIAAIGPGGDGRFQAEHRVLKADGSVVWLNARSTTFFRGYGVNRRPRMTIVAVRDITARKKSEEALRASEARYRSALLVGRVASWETNLVTRERIWTPEGKLLFDLDLPGLVGHVGGADDEYRNALHPADRHLMEHFHRLVDDTEEFAAEYRIQRRDGQVLWVTGRGQVMERDASGQPVRMLNVVADITERKLAEDAVKASEARFRMLAEAIPNIAWTATADGVLDWHSPRWSEYTGIATPSRGSDWQAPIHPDDQAKTKAAWESAIQDRRTFEVEHRIRDKDGVYRWFLSRAIPVNTDGEATVAWVGTATNIDALKTVEANLARYVAVASAAHDGLISITPDGIIESWNAGAERLFGYKAAEAIGQPTAMLVPEDGLPAHRDMLATVRSGGVAGPVDVKRRHKDGHLVDVAISMTAVTDARGTPIAVAKVAHDISGRIAAERRQQLLNRELAHRVKNSLAVLQAVMRATLRNSSSLNEFAATFTGRMHSMAAAQDLLTDREWRDAELGALAQRQLAPHVAASRIEFSGPVVELPSQLAVPLGLLLHELATNAVKYGALSVPEGRVFLNWSLEMNRSVPQVEIVWRERGGPPVVAPSRRGFGSVLIEEGLPAANVTRTFEADGVCCTIVIPLHEPSQEGDTTEAQAAQPAPRQTEQANARS